MYIPLWLLLSELLHNCCWDTHGWHTQEPIQIQKYVMKACWLWVLHWHLQCASVIPNIILMFPVNASKFQCLFVIAAVSCGSPVIPINGYYKGQTHYLETVTFHCNDGYNMTGSTEAICQANRQWTNGLGNCSRMYYWQSLLFVNRSHVRKLKVFEVLIALELCIHSRNEGSLKSKED